LVKKLDEIPGIDKILAIGIIAESTNDMSRFKDEHKYAAGQVLLLAIFLLLQVLQTHF